MHNIIQIEKNFKNRQKQFKACLTVQVYMSNRLFLIQTFYLFTNIFLMRVKVLKNSRWMRFGGLGD